MKGEDTTVSAFHPGATAEPEFHRVEDMDSSAFPYTYHITRLWNNLIN